MPGKVTELTQLPGPSSPCDFFTIICSQVTVETLKFFFSHLQNQQIFTVYFFCVSLFCSGKSPLQKEFVNVQAKL